MENKQLNYKVINRRHELVFCCTPLGEAYEIEVLLEDGSLVFVLWDDYYEQYSLSYIGVLNNENEEECFENDNDIILTPTKNYRKYKDSIYYPLYLELKKFIKEENSKKGE